ncbi:MAG: hypothetical protein IKP58_19565 [Victivallales bacterium]|nr:hypothetical protein [Victivallales bacterium]
MSKKSKNKKNKPSKAEKRLQKALYGDKVYSNEDIDVMEEHYNTLISAYWTLFSKTKKEKKAEELENNSENELAMFSQIAYLGEEAWNLAVLSDSLDDACDTAYETHDELESEIVTAMIRFKMEHYPQDKLMFYNTSGERLEDGNLGIKYELDYTVMDDEIDEQKENDRLAWEKLLDQEALAKALEGVPEEHQVYAYEAEVKRQIDALKQKYNDLLQDISSEEKP